VLVEPGPVGGSVGADTVVDVVVGMAVCFPVPLQATTRDAAMTDPMTVAGRQRRSAPLSNRVTLSFPVRRLRAALGTSRHRATGSVCRVTSGATSVACSRSRCNNEVHLPGTGYRWEVPAFRLAWVTRGERRGGNQYSPGCIGGKYCHLGAVSLPVKSRACQDRRIAAGKVAVRGTARSEQTQVDLEHGVQRDRNQPAGRIVLCEPGTIVICEHVAPVAERGRGGLRKRQGGPRHRGELSRCHDGDTAALSSGRRQRGSCSACRCYAREEQSSGQPHRPRPRRSHAGSG
jgi:hypothetical protein